MPSTFRPVANDIFNPQIILAMSSSETVVYDDVPIIQPPELPEEEKVVEETCVIDSSDPAEKVCLRFHNFAYVILELMKVHIRNLSFQVGSP